MPQQVPPRAPPLIPTHAFAHTQDHHENDPRIRCSLEIHVHKIDIVPETGVFGNAGRVSNTSLQPLYGQPYRSLGSMAPDATVMDTTISAPPTLQPTKIRKKLSRSTFAASRLLDSLCKAITLVEGYIDSNEFRKSKDKVQEAGHFCCVQRGKKSGFPLLRIVDCVVPFGG